MTYILTYALPTSLTFKLGGQEDSKPKSKTVQNPEQYNKYDARAAGRLVTDGETLRVSVTSTGHLVQIKPDVETCQHGRVYVFEDPNSVTLDGDLINVSRGDVYEVPFEQDGEFGPSISGMLSGIVRRPDYKPKQDVASRYNLADEHFNEIRRAMDTPAKGCLIMISDKLTNPNLNSVEALFGLYQRQRQASTPAPATTAKRSRSDLEASQSPAALAKHIRTDSQVGQSSRSGAFHSKESERFESDSSESSVEPGFGEWTPEQDKILKRFLSSVFYNAETSIPVIAKHLDKSERDVECRINYFQYITES